MEIKMMTRTERQAALREQMDGIIEKINLKKILAYRHIVGWSIRGLKGSSEADIPWLEQTARQTMIEALQAFDVPDPITNHNEGWVAWVDWNDNQGDQMNLAFYIEMKHGRVI